MIFKKKVSVYELEKEIDVLRNKIKLLESDIDSLRGLVNKKLGGRKKKDTETDIKDDGFSFLRNV